LKTILAAMLLTTSTLAQGQTSITSQACGTNGVWFNVRLDRGQASALPEPGKALVYFIQSIENLENITEIGGLTTAVGLDGAWVGAVKNNSYFSVSVEPGEHHVCARLQAHGWGEKRPEGLAQFTAEAGKVYFFHNRLIVAKQLALEFGPADHDQALSMIDTDRVSVSQPEK
jgi:hypothetical protein